MIVSDLLDIMMSESKKLKETNPIKPKRLKKPKPIKPKKLKKPKPVKRKVRKQSQPKEEGKCTPQRLAYSRKYRAANRARINDYSRRWMAQQTARTTCTCGVNYLKRNTSNHIKTNRHLTHSVS